MDDGDRDEDMLDAGMPFDDGDDDDDDNGDESDPLASDSEHEPDERDDLFGPSVDALLVERSTKRSTRRRSSRPGAKRRICDVPTNLVAAMGSATIAYMTKRFDEAEETLARIILEAPKAVAPYRTLALICEEKGDRKKTLSYLMFAAHLDRQDRDLWKRCAALSHELGDTDQAIYCLTNALKGTFGQDAESLRARADLLHQSAQYRKAVDSYVKLAKITPGDLSVTLSIAKMYRLTNKPQNAEPFLQDAIDYAERHPPRGVDQDTKSAHEASLASIVQCLIEIRFSQGRFDDASALLNRLQDRRALGDIQTPFLQRVMFAICQHRAGSRALASVAFNEFFAAKNVAAANPHLMWHVGAACMDSGDYTKAIKAYDAIATHEEHIDQVTLLLRRSKAYQELKNFDQAEKDICHALIIAPGHAGATLSLTRLQSTRERAAKSASSGVSDSNSDGDDNEAYDDVDDDAGPEASPGESANMWRRRKLKAAAKRVRSVSALRTPSSTQTSARSNAAANAKRDAVAVTAATAAALLSEADVIYHSGDKVKYFVYLAPVLEAALHLPRGNLISLAPSSSEFATLPKAQISVEQDQLNSVGQAMMRAMTDAKFVEFAERVFEGLKACGHADDKNSVPELLTSLARSRVKGDATLILRLRFLYITCLLEHGDLTGAYDELRMIAKECDSDDRVWWMYAVIDTCAMAIDDDDLRLRLFRSICRQSKRPNASTTVLMTAATVSSRGASSSQKFSISLLCKVFGQSRTSAAVALSIATNLLHYSRNRKAVNQDQILLKALTYLTEYRQLRREQFAGKSSTVKAFAELEADYNIGRALHDVGLVHMAAEMYHKVVEREVPKPDNTSGPACWPVWLDVRRDAAFNLVRIYRNSGAEPLAQAVMQQHLVF
jgi:tetratricopeptide (TPR) repeat protein